MFISLKIQKKKPCQNPQKDFSYESNRALIQKKSTQKYVTQEKIR